MHYTHLTSEERYSIWTLRKLGLSGRQVAKALGRSPSTISREVRRNVNRRGYRPRMAQRLADRRRLASRKPTKLTPETKHLIAGLLLKRWSPEQIAGRLRLQGLLQISHQTIYKYVAENKAEGGGLYRHLRRKRKYRKPYGTYRRNHIASKKSIDDRPQVADERSRVGDWEIDTLVSRVNKQVLVSLVERKSRYTLLARLPNREAFALAKKVSSMLQRRKAKVHTITSDNGTEFASFRYIENRLNAEFYFAHPYSSWERGTNENTNGLVREYFPKKQSFDSATYHRLVQVMKNLNQRPRKCLGFRTPEEVFAGRD